MKAMLILGGDRIAQKALAGIKFPDQVIVALDQSTSLYRVVKLVIRRLWRLSQIIKMLWCEYNRVPSSISFGSFPAIKKNNDLLSLLEKHKPERVLLFRAGLVINREVISRGIPLFNIHCANVPEYGGLGSIDRALKDGALDQSATLHKVTASIDKGEVFDTQPFRLNPSATYCQNEAITYAAGLELLFRTVVNTYVGRN